MKVHNLLLEKNDEPNKLFLLQLIVSKSSLMLKLDPIGTLN